MFDPGNPKNKFGYYSAGPYKSYSKFSAIEYSIANNTKLDWHFNDHVFDTVDWLTEPTESLSELYKQRAQQIRDQYDYVVLMYSGGIDSSNMVKVFFDNNILPDEVCSIHEYQGTQDRHAFLTGEILNSAIPWVAQNIPTQHHNKFRLVDTSERQFRAVENLNVDSISQHFYDFNIAHNLGNFERFNVREHVKEYKQIIDSGKKLCLVWGETKPYITLEPGNTRHQWKYLEGGLDMICNARDQEINDPSRHDELFYSTPDMPKIAIKQAHVCLDRLRFPERYPGEMIDESTVEKQIDSAVSPGFKIFNPILSNVKTRRNGRCMIMHGAILEKLIYPQCPPVIYNHGKNVNRLYHPRDEWIRKLAPDQSKHYYQEYIKKINPWIQKWKQHRYTGKYGVHRIEKLYFIE